MFDWSVLKYKVPESDSFALDAPRCTHFGYQPIRSDNIINNSIWHLQSWSCDHDHVIAISESHYHEYRNSSIYSANIVSNEIVDTLNIW